MAATRTSSRIRAKAKAKGNKSDPRARNNMSASDDDVIIVSSSGEDTDGGTHALKEAQEEIRSLKEKLRAKEALDNQKNWPPHPGPFPTRLKKSGDQQLQLKGGLQLAAENVNVLPAALDDEKEARDLMQLERRAENAENELASLTVVNQELHSQICLLNELHAGCKRKNDALNDLQNHILCEVCSETLWNPYMLSGCGHAFCQGCLTDWFNTADFKNGSEYTCPLCRASVLRRPVEDFVLKGLVHTISHVIDPTCSSPPPQPCDLNGKGQGLWDRFFG